MAKAELSRTFSNREEWLKARRRHIGASDSPSIFGVGYTDAKSVWAEKVGLSIGGEPEDDEEENEIDELDIGTIIQPSIIEVARRVLGIPITAEPDHTIRVHPDYPWLAASLDAWALDDSGLIVPVEIKNVGIYLARDWSSEEPPLAFNVQAHHQMAVTGAKRAILFGLIGGNKPAWHCIERNEAFIAAMLTRLEEFWGYVTRHEEPPDELSDPVKVAKAVAKLHPLDNGETVNLPIEFGEVLNELEAAKAAIKAAEAIKAKAEAKIKDALRDATYGDLADGRSISWKTQTRAEYVVAETTFRVLRASAKKSKK